MENKLSNISYEIAKTTDFEKDAIKKAENFLKEEIGKEYILIAWEKDNILN